MRWRQSRNLTAAQQYLALRSNPVCEGRGVLGRGQFTWTWHVAPSFLGRIYTLRVEFKQGGRPQVFVDQPDLVALAEGRKLPHVYSEFANSPLPLSPNVGRMARRLAHRQHTCPVGRALALLLRGVARLR